MANLFVLVTAGQNLAATLLAMRYSISATLPWPFGQLGDCGIATWTVVYNVRRPRTVFWFSGLYVACLFALMLTAVELPATYFVTVERAGPAFRNWLAVFGLVC